MTLRFPCATLTAVAVLATSLLAAPVAAAEPDAATPRVASPHPTVSVQTPSPDRPDEVSPQALSAEAEIDVARRVVQLTGRATPGASVVVDDLFEVEADSDGAWQTAISDVRLGPLTVQLVEYVGETAVDRATLELFVGAPVQAAANFPADRTQRAQVTGTATPGARVEVVDATGHVVGAVDAGTDGTFDADVLAPDAGGVRPYVVRQTLGGETVDQTTVTLDYGRAVQIAVPADGATHPGGPVALTGTGVPRGEVRVRLAGSSSWLAPATTVLASGSWRLTTSALDATRHDLEVVQIGRGANRTTASTVLNDGVDPTPPALLPGTVTGPTTYVSGRSTTITGQATPGATVTLTNAWQTPIVRGIVADRVTGAWQHTRILVAPSVYTIYVNQQLGAQTSTSPAFVIRPALDRPAFAVTSPDRQAGYVSGAVASFSGTGDPRGTVLMRNRWNTVITGPVDVGDDGRWTLRYLLVAPSTYYLTFVESTPGQPTRSQEFGAYAPRR